VTDPVADDDALVEDLRNSGTYDERFDVLRGLDPEREDES